MDDPSRDRQHGVPAAFASIWRPALVSVDRCWKLIQSINVCAVLGDGGKSIKIVLTAQIAVDSFHDKRDIFQTHNLKGRIKVSFKF